MAMEKFLMALVFCESPLDGYGTSVLSTGAIRKQQLVSGGGVTTTKPEARKADIDEKKQQAFSRKTRQQRRAGFELAFDGLNAFDTVVMH